MICMLVGLNCGKWSKILRTRNFFSKVLLWKMVVKIALMFARNREDVIGVEWMACAAEKIG